MHSPVMTYHCSRPVSRIYIYHKNLQKYAVFVGTSQNIHLPWPVAGQALHLPQVTSAERGFLELPQVRMYI
eukprot:1498271-Amphidinium_carterae.1